MRIPVLILLSILLVAPLWAQSAVQSRDGELSVVVGSQGPRVTDRKGFSNPLNLPDGVDISSLVPIRGGWLAGTDRTVGARRELYLRLLDPGGLKQIPSPNFQVGRLRVDPVLLTRENQLVGLVWLEGEDRQSLSVRFSRWLGITWSRPEVISWTGEAQLALDAVVLQDGSWLVTWAGYDGNDDEIYTSVVVGDSFTKPLAVTDNLVPDILPTLAVHETGPLLAWNHFDGEEYRVSVLRLIEGRWREGWTEARGTFYPHFQRLEGSPMLMFYRPTSGRRSWELAQIGNGGTVVRRGAAEAVSNERPLVLRREREGARLEWPSKGEARSVTWDRDIPDEEKKKPDEGELGQ